MQGEKEGDDEINPANPGFPDQTHFPIMDAGEDDPDHPANQFLAQKLSPEDHQRYKNIVADSRRKHAEDRKRADDVWHRRAEDARKRLGRDETEEEAEAREKREAARKHLGRDETPEEAAKREKHQADDRKRRADDRKRADDRRQADDRRARDAVNPQANLKTPMPGDKKVKAMDEATVQAAIDEAVSKERVNQRAIQDALREARSYVGDLNIAFDSAEQVFRKALEMQGETDLDSVHPSAYRRLLLSKPLPGRAKGNTTVAMDSAATSAAKINEQIGKIAPGALKIRVG